MFRSNRPTSQQFDIWIATRATTTVPFEPPNLVPNVNSTGDDGPSWLSLDGCRMYISSDRDGPPSIDLASRGT